MTARTVVLTLASCLALAGCSLLPGDDEGTGSRPDRIDPLTSMTEAGVRLAGDALDEAPRYDVRATVAPASGRVRGTVRAELPVGPGARVVELRYFAGVPDFEIDARLGEVDVEGPRSRRVGRRRSCGCRCPTGTTAGSR